MRLSQIDPTALASYDPSAPNLNALVWRDGPFGEVIVRYIREHLDSFRSSPRNEIEAWICGYRLDEEAWLSLRSEERAAILDAAVEESEES